MKFLLASLALLPLATAQAQRAAPEDTLPLRVTAHVALEITQVTDTSMAVSFPLLEGEDGDIALFGILPDGTWTVVDLVPFVADGTATFQLHAEWLSGFKRLEAVQRAADGRFKMLATVTSPATGETGEAGTSAKLKCTDGPCKLVKEWIDSGGNLKSHESTIPTGAIVVIPSGSTITVTCMNGCSAI